MVSLRFKVVQSRIIALVFLCVTTINLPSLWCQSNSWPWIVSEKEYLFPLEAIEAGHHFADLEPLRQVFQDVRVIALGEATHGTREFFQCKHRLLEFLVCEMKCRLFAVEYSYAFCQLINDYVLGTGTYDDVLYALNFSIYKSQEVTDMIDWMRAYNQTVEASDKVQFVGFDCQLNDLALISILHLLQEGDPDYYETALSLLLPETFVLIAEADEQELLQITAQIQEVSDHLIANESEWKSSSQDYEQVMFLIHLLKQECETHGYTNNQLNRVRQFIQNEHPELSTDLEEQGEFFFLSEEMQLQYPELLQIAQDIHHQVCLRDRFMSENIMMLLRNLPETDRMVVWAHNGHIALHESDGIPPMGSYLHDKLGQSYYALGFVTSSGTFQALNQCRNELTVFSIPLLPENSWAHHCSKFGQDQFLLSFRSAPQYNWMYSSLPLIFIGNTFSDSLPFFINHIPLNYFDGLIYIRETSAAHPTGPCCINHH